MATDGRTGGTVPNRDLSQTVHRRLIGVLGLALPILLYILAGVRPTPTLPPWRLLDSISSYYYTGAVGVLVGVLFALSLFLLSYRGYEGSNADTVLGTIGGLSALGVALFPTTPPTGVPEPPWWEPYAGVIHYTCAVVLLLSFVLFSVWLFPKSDKSWADRGTDKRVRDIISYFCGAGIIAGIAWAGLASASGRPIFWPESLAIASFAISWLAKGQLHRPVIKFVEGTRRSLPRNRPTV